MEGKFPHRGITMHQIGVGGNIPGIVFALGSALIFLLAIPALWVVTVGALAAGFAIAAILQIVRRKPEDSATLSLKV